MPLQNRVSPFGELLAVPARGTLFGNRGGRLRRWVSQVLDPTCGLSRDEHFDALPDVQRITW